MKIILFLEMLPLIVLIMMAIFGVVRYGYAVITDFINRLKTNQ